MNLNVTTKYAIKILEFMVQDSAKKYSAKLLSIELEIPYKYLARIMTMLKNSKLVISSQGKYGGFSLGKNPKDIRLVDILVVFDDPHDNECVVSDGKCNFKDKCTLHDKWQKPRCYVDDFYTKTTLDQLIK